MSKPPIVSSSLPDIADPRHWALFIIHNLLTLVVALLIVLCAAATAVASFTYLDKTVRHSVTHVGMCSSEAERSCAVLYVMEDDAVELNLGAEAVVELRTKNNAYPLTLSGKILSINPAAIASGEVRYQLEIELEHTEIKLASFNTYEAIIVVGSHTLASRLLSAVRSWSQT